MILFSLHLFSPISLSKNLRFCPSFHNTPPGFVGSSILFFFLCSNIISFLNLTLGLACSFSSFLRYKIRGVRSVFSYNVGMTILNCPLCVLFCFVCLSLKFWNFVFSFVLRYFLISLLIYFDPLIVQECAVV